MIIFQFLKYQLSVKSFLLFLFKVKKDKLKAKALSYSKYTAKRKLANKSCCKGC